MDHNAKITQQLNAPDVPAELEQRILATWQAQMHQPAKSARRWRPGLALAASLLLASVLGFQTLSTPTLVEAALNDIDKDAGRHSGLGISIESLVSMHEIQAPPSTMAIVMSKLCTINGVQTTHLVIQGEQRGEVHLFIKPGVFERALLQAQQGTARTMPWQIINTGKDLSVLVLYSSDMNPDTVQTLIQQMFIA